MVSIRGARHENQDALYINGQLFSVFDGHIGKSTALGLLTFRDCKVLLFGTHTTVSGSKEVAGHGLKTQQNLADISCKICGCTAITCWIEPGDASASSSTAAAAAETQELRRTQGGENDAQETAEPLREARQAEPMTEVCATCLGDSMACLFDSRTGGFVASKQRAWDL
jgi:serine/threonine protein phosphatase PrpC